MSFMSKMEAAALREQDAKARSAELTAEAFERAREQSEELHAERLRQARVERETAEIVQRAMVDAIARDRKASETQTINTVGKRGEA